MAITKESIERVTGTDAPKWLLVMRAITGLTEAPGDPDNPKILAMARIIARAYPEMQSYCDQYQHDSTAWCGLCAAFCMTVAGVRPPFGPTDTDKFLWALAWADDRGFPRTSPTPGAVIVKEREGGGHVTFYESTEGGNYRCRGGNQSDAVNVQSYPISDVVGVFWPLDFPQPEIPVEDRPLLEEGDSGSDVADLQRMIPNFSGEIDGDFGPITKEAVARYQLTRGLEVDGICGEQTWGALYADKAPIPLPEPPEPPPDALSQEDQQAIKEIARDSAIADYNWEDRSVAPVGYTCGMALAFAQSYLKLKANHPAAVEMAKARTNSDKDALNVYREDFNKLGHSNERAGVDTLRGLYTLMLGQGMRESSGEFCCGRDMSASNVQSDTAEAGLFQTSYNAAGASNPEFDNIMDEFARRQSPGYLAAFSEDVSCSSSDWSIYGSGRGAEFQLLCKVMPAFAAESCGLTLRNLCNHYGPIVRHETELKREADEMLQQVQDYIDDLEGVA